MDINALVEIQLPTQPIPSYFFRIIKKKKKQSRYFDFAMSLTL